MSDRAGGKTTTQLLLHQYKYDQKEFWREPAGVFFTVVMPLIFLFLFVSIFGNDALPVRGHEIKASTYYVPGIVTLALVSATSLNLAITFTILREKGQLKRVRSTPLPPWIYLGGRVLTATVVCFLLTAALVLLGWVVYDVSVPTNTLPGLLVTLVLGTVVGCALGFAFTAIIPSANSAPAVTNAIVLPLYFFSGIFVPDDTLPDSMKTIGSLFPVRHLFQAFLFAFDPATKGTGIAVGHLAVVAAWGIAAGLVGVRYFRWTPRG
ncbi:MAG: ABC transporter permease [Acidimicrobiales bacterium]